MSKREEKLRERLMQAQEKKSIISFSRGFEPGSFTGYVMALGPKFFVLASLDDGFKFENYVCLRIRDIEDLEAPAKYEAFYNDVRRLRGDKFPPSPKLDLTSAASILYSARKSLVTIHREKLNPDTCVIGYGLSDNAKILEFLEIGPDAKWDETPSYLRIKDITRIDLPGPYEEALLLVGGKPEALRKKKA